MKKVYLILFLLVLVSACSLKPQARIIDFESCVAAGNPVMETYPRQCRANGQNYVEIIKDNLNNTNQVACDLMAKLCPDGSAVGRSGPNCEFAPCSEVNSIISEAEARAIAEKNCIKGGEALTTVIYNQGTKTWWFDANLNATKEGCNPACVVNEITKTAEINWRCTGLIEPKE